MLIIDRLTIDKAAKVRKTTDGYVAAYPRVARTGVQTYAGRELGRPDLGTVSVYRPHEEVFAPDSLRSYAHRPMTNDHPPVPVVSDNWKKYAVGHTGDEIMRDGETIRVPMVLMDAQSIKDYEAGKKELSLGYTCDLKWESGETPGGVKYDAVQTNIRANHLALVDAARGGPELNIGDDNEDAMKTIIIDGLPATLNDETSTKIIEKALADRDAKITALTTANDGLTKTIETRDGTIKDRDGKIVELETKNATLETKVKDSALTPAKLDAAVVARAELIGKGKALLGDKLVVKDKTDHEIRKQVVDAKVGVVAKDYDETKYAISFDTLTADIKVEVSDAQHMAGMFDANRNGTKPQGADAAYGAMINDMENAWKGPAHKAN